MSLFLKQDFFLRYFKKNRVIKGQRVVVTGMALDVGEKLKQI